MHTLFKVLLVACMIWPLAVPASGQETGDPEKGERVFKKCKACHMVGEGAKKRIGPPLNDIIGATAGAQEGYNYSPAMKKAGAEGLVWTEETLFEYLENPRKMVPGSKMVFPGLRKESDRRNVIAYLKKFSDSGSQ